MVMHAEAPETGGARIVLRGVDRVMLGRGSTRGTRMIGKSTLRIDLADSRVSVEHATIQRVIGKWLIEDLGSKNGLFIDGQRVERHPLDDGNWIEIGHTFLRFRHSIAGSADADPPSVVRTLMPAFQVELDKVVQVAASKVPVLLRGETGTGKEVMARELHDLSHRTGPFVAINCGAIPTNLVESTLFGHRKGAFSGALENRPGVVVSADGGTLLLDEIGDLPLPQQSALLRVLQESEVVPVGESRPRSVDVRFVAATHRDLDEMVNRERFRGDLLARLAGVRITLPPLRERIEDLGVLVTSILGAAGADGWTIARDAALAMCRHTWPFNVRELEHALRGALATASSRKIELAHLPDELRQPRPAIDRDQIRRDELITHLQKARGNLAAVARAFGTSRSQVHRLLMRFGIDPGAYR
jgi:DNA-binding NtrC family response regulator